MVLVTISKNFCNWLVLSRFSLKSHNKNSGLFRTSDTKKSAPIFVPFWASTCEFDIKTRHCETKNATPVQYCFVNSNNYCNSLIECQWWQTAQLMRWPHWFFSIIVIKYQHFLWPPCVTDADIIFLSCAFFYLSSFFLFFIPCLISVVTDWMSTNTILPHMVWP